MARKLLNHRSTWDLWIPMLQARKNERIEAFSKGIGAIQVISLFLFLGSQRKCSRKSETNGRSRPGIRDNNESCFLSYCDDICLGIRAAERCRRTGNGKPDSFCHASSTAE